MSYFEEIINGLSSEYASICDQHREDTTELRSSYAELETLHSSVCAELAEAQHASRESQEILYKYINVL